MGNSSGKQKKEEIATTNEVPASRDSAEPGSSAPLSGEGATANPDAPKRAAQNIKFDQSNYKLLTHTEVQYNSCTYKQKAVDFYGLVTVEAPSYEFESRPGIDCVCVLDVSGSMRGQKISLVRKSMRRLVRNLGAKDRVCFITFDTNVNTLMGFTQMDEVGKEKARNLVKDLNEGSSTNLAGGLVSGIEAIRDNFQNEVTSVLLFTDGEANVGEQSVQGILKLAKEAAGHSSDPSEWSAQDVSKWLTNCGLGQYSPIFLENSVDGMMLLNDIDATILRSDLQVKPLHMKKFEREISTLKEKVKSTNEGEGETGPQMHLVVNTFGFGASHNNELLEKIASSFDGMYFFMKDEAAIVAGFANCLGGMLSTVAQEIKLTFKACKGVKNLKVYKDDNKKENKDGSISITFGDIQSEEKRHILVSAVLPKISKADPCYKFFNCEISYKNLVRETDDKDSLTATINRSGKMGLANVEVDVSKNRVVAAEAMQTAENLGDARKLAEARKVINEAKSLIEKSVSSQDEFCQNLIQDLNRCLDGLQDEQQFDYFGKGYMVQNAMCLDMERAANFDADYATQSQYNNVSRGVAYENFARSDSMDSCDHDFYQKRSLSPPYYQQNNTGGPIIMGDEKDYDALLKKNVVHNQSIGLGSSNRTRSLSLSLSVSYST